MEMEKYIADDQFNSYMEDFNYFTNNDVTNTSYDDNHMEEFQVLIDSSYINNVIYFTSVETTSDTYDQYMGAEV